MQNLCQKCGLPKCQCFLHTFQRWKVCKDLFPTVSATAQASTPQPSALLPHAATLIRVCYNFNIPPATARCSCLHTSSVRWPSRHAVRKRCEWTASYSGVQKRVSVQFTFAAAVRGWTEWVAFMSSKIFCILFHLWKSMKKFFVSLQANF